MKPGSVKSQWRKRLSSARSPYRPWLIDRGSLTQRIQARCGAFSVRAVHQRHSTACRDELALIGVRYAELTLLREVYLYCHETPVVFAHSALAVGNLRGAWESLARQGAKPLGAALFANPKVVRAPLAFRQLDRHSTLYRRACRVLQDPPPYLWARRSRFSLQGRPILVTEVFLPGILDLKL